MARNSNFENPNENKFISPQAAPVQKLPPTAKTWPLWLHPMKR